jgi:hypothetical protein
MKVRLPKSFIALPQSEKDIINEVMSKEVEDQVNKNMAKLQKLWLQFACIVLNKNFGFGKKRATLFLGNWKEMYRYNNKLKNEAEQTAFLQAEMDRIFGKEGYPTKYIDKLEDMG